MKGAWILGTSLQDVRLRIGESTHADLRAADACADARSRIVGRPWVGRSLRPHDRSFAPRAPDSGRSDAHRSWRGFSLRPRGVFARPGILGPG